MRRHSHPLAVLMVAGCAYAVSSGYTDIQTTADDVRLTLSSQTVWQYSAIYHRLERIGSLRGER